MGCSKVSNPAQRRAECAVAIYLRLQKMTLVLVPPPKPGVSLGLQPQCGGCCCRCTSSATAISSTRCPTSRTMSGSSTASLASSAPSTYTTSRCALALVSPSSIHAWHACASHLHCRLPHSLAQLKQVFAWMLRQCVDVAFCPHVQNGLPVCRKCQAITVVSGAV